jgi:Ca-activated chloride channel family protein
MTAQLPLLSEEEAKRLTPTGDEPGFGNLATARGSLPLKALDVHARIDGLLAEVTVSQTFVNTHAEPLEATYIFPLPDRAAVTRFHMEVAGRVVEGVLKERGAARREYDEAVKSGHRAAITEEERPGVFTLRVGNLMPGESATVRLTLAGPLPYSDGEATFRFPLVVAPRYIPGAPLPGASVGAGTVPDTDAVPDASRITPPVLLPGFPNPIHLSLTVDVAPSAIPLGDFRSSLHAVLEVVSDSGARRILVQPGERANRDFILRFRLGDGAVRTALTLTPDAGAAQEGTFALTVVPPAGPEQGPRPRDVIFVLDRSGSMGGWKIVAARRALEHMVDSLTERDRFAVYAFDHEVEKPPAFPGLGLQPATDRNRFRAVEFLAKVDARGGTEMAQPLALASHQLAGSTRVAERILVLITDGQVGNEDQILRSLAGELRGVRVFTLGIDQAVNAAFLRRLADLGGGACELVESEECLDKVLEQIHRRIGNPVLTDLRLAAAGFQAVEDTLVPRRSPDLFAGAPLCLLGRYRGSPEGRVSLQATSAEGGAWRWWSQEVPTRTGGNAALPAVWARGHLRDLEDRFVTGRGDVRRLEKDIVETSLRFGVLCRFTAFVAVDRAEAPNRGGRREQVLQPVDAPQGWDMLKALPPGAPGAASFGFARAAAAPPGGGSLQHKLDRVRRPRAQITYDLEAGGAMKKTELPFVVGVLADLSGWREQPLKPLKERKAPYIDRDNFEDMLQRAGPALALEVANRLAADPPTLQVRLRFRWMCDFSPAAVADQVPALRELQQRRSSLAGQAEALADLDRKLSAQLAAILDHPDFRRLETTWRGLFYLVHESETGESLKIRVLNVTREELREDFRRAGAFDRSTLFKKIYEEEYGSLGGKPYALLVGDYEFGEDAEDVRLLGEIARVAAWVHAPFVAAASPRLFGLERFADLTTRHNPAACFAESASKDWQRFRAAPESRYAALTLPRVLARPLRRAESWPAGESAFAELADGDNPLWMSAAWAFAVQVTGAVAKYGWPARICGAAGGGKVEGLPGGDFPADGGGVAKDYPAEFALADGRALELAALGILPLVRGPDGAAFFAGAHSCHRPAVPGDPAARLDYLLCASRFVHYLKVMARDYVGAFMEVKDCQRWFNDWLARFVLADPDRADEGAKVRQPLQEAQATIQEDPQRPPGCLMAVRLRPHYQLEPVPPSAALLLEAPLPRRT